MKICAYCGTEYEENFANQQLCKKCFRIVTGRTRAWNVYTDVDQREFEIKTEWMKHAPDKNDRIVGDGYADRQKADTLSKVEKIRTEL